jgi:hypothetical protein
MVAIIGSQENRAAFCEMASGDCEMVWTDGAGL